MSKNISINHHLIEHISSLHSIVSKESRVWVQPQPVSCTSQSESDEEDEDEEDEEDDEEECDELEEEECDELDPELDEEPEEEPEPRRLRRRRRRLLFSRRSSLLPFFFFFLCTMWVIAAPVAAPAKNPRPPARPALIPLDLSSIDACAISSVGGSEEFLFFFFCHLIHLGFRTVSPSSFLM